MRTGVAGLVLAALLASGCGVAPTPSPVALPADAPLTFADCGWPDGTALAYAGWFDEAAQLSLPATFGLGNGTERAFAIVSLGRITQHPMVGPDIVARGGCVRRADGRLVVSTVPDDWRKPTP
jgi:hypothetical protein